MSAKQLQYNEIVERIYGMSLEDKKELKNLLEHNIAEERRNEIAANYKEALIEEKTDKLKFSSEIDELKKFL